MLLFFWSNWDNSSVCTIWCGVPLSSVMGPLFSIFNAHGSSEVELWHWLQALANDMCSCCVTPVELTSLWTQNALHLKSNSHLQPFETFSLESLMCEWEIRTNFMEKSTLNLLVKMENRNISLCISVTRPLRLLRNLKEWVENGDNHFYLRLLIDLEIILSIHLQK